VAVEEHGSAVFTLGLGREVGCAEAVGLLLREAAAAGITGWSMQMDTMESVLGNISSFYL
jgi:hypothetical protein